MNPARAIPEPAPLTKRQSSTHDLYVGESPDAEIAIRSAKRDMEFQGTIRGASGVPLGSPDAIEATLQRLFAGLSFAWTRNGAEKLADMDSKGIVVPALVRKVLHSESSNRCAQWSDGTVDVTLNLGNGQEVASIWMTISGDDWSGNRILAMLRDIPGWSVDSPESLGVIEVGSTDQVTNDGTARLYFEENDTSAGS